MDQSIAAFVLRPSPHRSARAAPPIRLVVHSRSTPRVAIALASCDGHGTLVRQRQRTTNESTTRTRTCAAPPRHDALHPGCLKADSVQ